MKFTLSEKEPTIHLTLNHDNYGNISLCANGIQILMIGDNGVGYVGNIDEEVVKLRALGFKFVESRWRVV